MRWIPILGNTTCLSIPITFDPSSLLGIGKGPKSGGLEEDKTAHSGR